MTRADHVTIQILVLAKTPVPGRVKTRLCPPWTLRQAADIAAAALADTITTVTATPDAVRTLVIDGDLPAPPGWRRIVQRGTTLAERLAHAYADSWMPGLPSLLIGMDTPHLSVIDLVATGRALATSDAVLGLAEDGGWWALGLQDSGHAALLRGIRTSAPDTGTSTLEALRRHGLAVAMLPVMRDVDTAEDAHAVAGLCPPESLFARAVPQAVTA
jgi:glycosyltransferase A (GT-A) superfamily protein (DUF2064 family)